MTFSVCYPLIKVWVLDMCKQLVFNCMLDYFIKGTTLMKKKWYDFYFLNLPDSYY